MSSIGSPYTAAMTCNNRGVQFLGAGSYAEANKCFRAGLVLIQQQQKDDTVKSHPLRHRSTDLLKRKRVTAPASGRDTASVEEAVDPCNHGVPERRSSSTAGRITKSTSALGLFIANEAVLLRTHDTTTPAYYTAIVAYNYALSCHLKSTTLSAVSNCHEVTALKSKAFRLYEIALKIRYCKVQRGSNRLDMYILNNLGVLAYLMGEFGSARRCHARLSSVLVSSRRKEGQTGLCSELFDSIVNNFRMTSPENIFSPAA